MTTNKKDTAPQPLCVDCELATQATHYCPDCEVPVCNEHAGVHEADGCEVEEIDAEEPSEFDDDFDDEFEDDEFED